MAANLCKPKPDDAGMSPGTGSATSSPAIQTPVDAVDWTKAHAHLDP
jgi:hypothetical protein